mgnify:CR=1 FL=1
MTRLMASCLALMLGATMAGAQVSVQSYETPGNLAPTQNRGCITLAQADPGLSPPDLALSVLACARKNRPADAAALWDLMIARGMFDTERVTDKTAHQAVEVLALQTRAELSPTQLSKISAAQKRLVPPGRPAEAAFCAQLQALGAPRHDPTWMTAHGMQAFRAPGKPALARNFNAEKAWKTALNSALRCAN